MKLIRWNIQEEKKRCPRTKNWGTLKCNAIEGSWEKEDIEIENNNSSTNNNKKKRWGRGYKVLEAKETLFPEKEGGCHFWILVMMLQARGWMKSIY